MLDSYFHMHLVFRGMRVFFEEVKNEANSLAACGVFFNLQHFLELQHDRCRRSLESSAASNGRRNLHCENRRYVFGAVPGL